MKGRYVQFNFIFISLTLWYGSYWSEGSVYELSEHGITYVEMSSTVEPIICT